MGCMFGTSRPIDVGADSDIDHDMADDYDSPLTDLEDSADDNEYSSLEETFSESSGSEYGGKTYKKQPAKKRARASDTGKVPATKGAGRKKKTLSLIVTMSIDILLEIFSFLEPADLLFLSRANKAFRRVLLSKSAVSVWKAARINRGGVPNCMPNMSEVQWAHLLFGGSQCCVCGTNGIMRIDFGLRRRACTSCLKKNLVYKPNFSSKFPDFDPIIMDLVTFTNIGGWAHGHASGSKFFWSDDIFNLAARLGAYQKDVHMRKPGAKKRLEDFKSSCKKYVDFVVKHAMVCNAWVDEDRKRQQCMATELQGQNKELIKARLVHLGHDANDVARMFQYHKYNIDKKYSTDKELTDARWKRLLPTIERDLSELKEKWLLEDQRYASDRRKMHLREMYNNYVRQLRRPLAPSFASFLKLCDVADFLNSPPTVDQESDTNACRAFADKLPDFCTGYIRQTKIALTQFLNPSTGISQYTLTPKDQGINAPDETLLQLATSIFQCANMYRSPLITWDKVQHHTCQSSFATFECTLSISQSGVAAARSLLSLVGLDAKTTTATTMDHLQHHFFCLNCPPKSENGGSYRMAMDWRRSVFHHVDQHHSHAEPRWELLSAAQLQVIRGRHLPEYPRATDRVWYCNKCERHQGNPVDKATVIDHIRWHGIAAPNQGVDFSYDMAPVKLPPAGTKFFFTPLQPPQKQTKDHRYKHTPPQPPQKQTKDYRCKHCNDSRCFILEGVKMHIKAKHKIDSSCEGTDFYKIK